MAHTTNQPDSLNRQIRVMVWGQPRGLTTALMRSFECVPNVELVYEPYSAAAICGPQRHRGYLGVDLPTIDRLTFAFVKDKLESEFDGKRLIVVKDFPFSLKGDWTHLPDGYKHVFFIRHPARAFTSSYRVLASIVASDQAEEAFKHYWKGAGLNYPDLQCLYDEITRREGGKQPLIFDADDLLRDPKGMLKNLCTNIGIDYTESMLKWDEKQQIEWNAEKEYLEADKKIFHGNSLSTTGFFPWKPLPDLDEMPKVVQEYVDVSLECYERLRSKCLPSQTIENGNESQ